MNYSNFTVESKNKSKADFVVWSGFGPELGCVKSNISFADKNVDNKVLDTWIKQVLVKNLLRYLEKLMLLLKNRNQ